MKPKKSAKSQSTDLEELDRLYHKLRGQINALGLCVRVLQTGPPPRDMEDYAGLIAETSGQIKKLVDKLQLHAKKSGNSPRRAG